MSRSFQVDAEAAGPARDPARGRSSAAPQSSPQPRLLKPPSSGAGLGRTTERWLLQLQGTYGNQYVQRLARGEEAEASADGALIARAPDAVQRDEARTKVTVTTGAVRNSTFNVNGATLEDAGEELNALPEWGQGGARNIRYTAGASDDEGIVQRITITAVLFTRLPRWTRLRRQPERVRNEWNRMLAALRGHEDHHVAIAREHLNDLKNGLDGIHEDDLAGEWDSRMAALQAAQDDYDATTTSGQTEGVSLDLSVMDEEEEGEGEPEAEAVGVGE